MNATHNSLEVNATHNYLEVNATHNYLEVNATHHSLEGNGTHNSLEVNANHNSREMNATHNSLEVNATHNSPGEVSAAELLKPVVAEVEAGERHVVLHRPGETLGIPVRELVTCVLATAPVCQWATPINTSPWINY